MAQVSLQVAAAGALNAELQADVESILLPQAVAATLTTEPTGVDLLGCESAIMAVHAGALTDGEYTIALVHSDDDGATDAYAAVTDGLWTNAGELSDFAVIDGTTDNMVHYRVVRNTSLKRWVNVTVTETSAGATGVVLSIELIKSAQRYQPDVSTAA